MKKITFSGAFYRYKPFLCKIGLHKWVEIFRKTEEVYTHPLLSQQVAYTRKHGKPPEKKKVETIVKECKKCHMRIETK